MKEGAGHSKGSKFERDVSALLDKWWKVPNKTFWRTKGSGAFEEPGDIAPRFRQNQEKIWWPFIVECKHYKTINFVNLFLKNDKKKTKNKLIEWWEQSTREQKEAVSLGYDLPMRLVIFKLNNFPICVMFNPLELEIFNLSEVLLFHSDTKNVHIAIAPWKIFSEQITKSYFEETFR